MLVSVTPLGSISGDRAAAASSVVSYLQGKVGAGRTAERGDDTAAVEGYYADSLEGPGHWAGNAAAALGVEPGTEVEPDTFRTLLEGRHPVSGQALNARARPRATSTSPTRSVSRADELTGLDVVADELGLSQRHVRRLAASTQRAVASVVGALLGAPAQDVPLPATPLFAERDPDGRWLISRDELERFRGAGGRRRVVIGYDVTFSAPKSVSILWATATPRQRHQVMAGVDAAVHSALEYLETVTRARSGPDAGATHGLTAALFCHTTSRNLDPQLHVHTVIANLVQTLDGKTRAVDGRPLFAHAKTAGYLAAAELRHQLATRLGCQWGEAVHGLADVTGVPSPAIQAMSSRKHEIDSLAAELGVHSASARQVAAWRTRSAKTDAVDPAVLRHEWDEHLRGVGFDEPARAACYQRQPTPARITATERHQLLKHLASAKGVTEQAASFDRRDVLQAVATWGHDRLPVTEITELADEFLASEHVIELNSRLDGRDADVIRRRDGRAVSSVTGDAVYSTPAILAAEARILSAVEAGLDGDHGLVSDQHLQEALSVQPSLGTDQRAMVRGICQSGDQIQCVLGPAGSGKTYALNAAQAAWSAAGYHVLGAAEQGSAAELLARHAGLQAETLEHWLTLFDTNPTLAQDLLGPGTVMIVDEASTIGTRTLDRLLRHARATGTVVRLIGDPAQHSAVTAGGGFRSLLGRHYERSPKLTVERRQAAPHLRQVRLAVADYRKGKVAAALDRLAEDGRVVEAPTADVVLDQLVNDWWADRQAHTADPTQPPSRMMAEHHRDRRELNRRARHLLAAHGLLTGPTLEVAGQEFRAGDEIICRTPAKHLHPPGEPRRHVRNGTHGHILAVTPADDTQLGSLLVDFDGRGPIPVSPDFLTRRLRPGVTGGLTHAYALTTHAAQGDTYQTGRTLTTDRSSRPGIYVGLTRGRNDTRLYTVRQRDLIDREDEDHMPALDDERATLQAIAHQLAASRPERLATNTDPTANTAAELRNHYSLVELCRLDPHPAGIDKAALSRAIAAHAHAITLRARIHPDPTLITRIGPRPPAGPDRSAWDAAVNATALAQITRDLLPPARTRAKAFGLPDQQTATRLTRAAEIHALARRSTADLAVEARLIATTVTANARGATHAPQRTAAQHPSAREKNDDALLRARAKLIEAALGLQVARAAQAATTNPPAYINRLLGTRPADAAAAARWDRHVRTIEQYRHLIRGYAPTTPTPTSRTAVEAALGPRPDTPVAQATWTQVQHEVCSSSHARVLERR